jgi:hypothetical protein
MKHITLLVVLLTLVQGCASIAQPTASRPLVEHEFVTPSAAIDVSLSTALTNAKTGAAITIQQKSVVMGERFFAASGLSCRKLTIELTGQAIYCLNNDSRWFKVKKVISEYNEFDMSEAIL